MSHMLSLVLATILQGRYHYVHLVDGKLRLKAVQRTAQGHSAGKRLELPLKPILFSLMTPWASVFSSVTGWLIIPVLE